MMRTFAASWRKMPRNADGLPSQTNFLLVHFGPETAAIEQALFERGVIVRPMAGYGLGDYLRITVATRPENERLLANLKAVLS